MSVTARKAKLPVNLVERMKRGEVDAYREACRLVGSRGRPVKLD